MSIKRTDNGRSTRAMRHNVVGRIGDGVPVVGFDHRPGITPVAVARLPVTTTDLPLPPYGTHAHDFLVLFYAHRAGGTLRIDDRPWALTDGDLLVIAPGQVVSFEDPHEQIATEGWAVWFPADVVRAGPSASWRTHPLLFPFAGGADRAQRLHIPPGDRPAWVHRFTELDDELRTRRDGHEEAALAHLTLLLVAVGRLPTAVADQLRSADEPLLAAVFDVIETRYHETISLADVAADLALTPGHLTTVVRRKTGRTVQQWLAQRRMRQARRLLTDTGLTVAAISRRVGYPDVSYFIKRFRAEHGITPAQWRMTRN